MAHHRVVSLLFLGAILAWGCALSTHGLPADASGAGGAGAGTAQSSTATTSSEASATATSTSGATTTSSTATTTSTTTSSTAATTSSSTATTTSTTTSSTTTSTTSGGGPCVPGANNVCCGTTACGIPPNKCCFDQGTQDNSTCVMGNANCPGGTFEMRCDAGEDCPGGKVCCGAWDGGKYTSMTCTDMNMCTPPALGGAAGTYPSCNYPGGACPGTLHCYSATSIGGTHGYCYY